ncbi:MAG: C10 family peptidase [Prolixibacteraceae bacterium]|nr:C10 family peptidase [Prolixibacteraceae bacterium]
MKYLILLLCFVLIQPLYARKVEKEKILKVVKTVLKEKGKDSQKVKELIPLGLKSDTTIYVAALKDSGFIIISADYSAPPVLGNTFYGEYNPEVMPPGLLYLIEKYQYSIGVLRDQKIGPTDVIEKMWNEFLQDDGSSSMKSGKIVSTSTVSSMTKTEWGQSNGYNMYCPDGCLAGCTAVAMAQILYYWNISVAPTGSHTFDGQTANFGNTQYCWRNMAQLISNSANALLIFHAGVSCNTTYGSGGSYSGTVRATTGFNNYWGMNASYYLRFLTFNWEDRMIAELVAGRPILYGGGRFEGFDYIGHNWVIDGYDPDQGFWCNWGWEGYNNGYFNLGNFDPPGNAGPYNDTEDAIFGIYPDNIYNPGIITGPSTLTSTGATYTISDPPSCAAVSWIFSSNIESYYGGDDYIALRATESGTGWIEAFYDDCGNVVELPRIYVTLSY